MDIGVTISKVRKEYKEYLRETHPDWADTTISTHVSDAFYLYQNTIALSDNTFRERKHLRLPVGNLKLVNP